MKTVFLDSASTTQTDKRVVEAMIPCFTEYYGNPSSQHSIGRKADELVNDARMKVAKVLNANSSEIYFTSSGTEANNMALIGLARANKERGNHIITTKIEHQSVLDACKILENEGFNVSYIEANKDGLVNLDELEKSITDKTILISVMLCNNETGTVQDIQKIKSIINEKNVLLHTDAVAGMGNIDIDVKNLKVDALSVSAQKIYGPKGVGCLFVKKGTKIKPIIHGGNQEKGKRAGTSNVPAIVGFGKACELLDENKDKNRQKIQKLRDYFCESLIDEDVVINCKNTIPNIVSITFKGVDNTLMQTLLDIKGVCCSLGSACTAGSTMPSHVLLGMGFSEEYAKNTLRFSFNKYLEIENIEYAIQTIKSCLNSIKSKEKGNK